MSVAVPPNFNSILSAAPCLLWACDEEGTPTFLTPALRDFLGLGTGDFSGWEPVLAPEDRTKFQTQLREALGQRRAIVTDHRLRRFDGEFRHVRHSLSPMQDNTGRFLGVTGSLMEVAPPGTSVEFDHTGDVYRLLVENVNDGIVISQDDRFIYLNRRFAEMLGYDQQELGNRNYMDIYTAEGFAILMARKARRDRGEEVPSRYETFYRRKDGSSLCVEANVTIIQYRGRPATFAIVRDMTERRRLEQERQAFSRLGMDLSGADSLEKVAQIVSRATEEIFAWDALTFSVRRSGESRYRTILKFDTVEGRKVQFPGSEWVWKEDPTLAPLYAGHPVLINRPPGHTKPVLPSFGNESRRSASLIFAPIRRGPTVIGTISVQSYTPFKYDEAARDLLQRVADAVSTAMERCLAEKRSASLSALGERLSAARSPREVAEIIVQLADEVIGWDACALNLYNWATDTVEPLLSRDLVENRRTDVTPSAYDSAPSPIQRRIVKEGALLILNETIDWERTQPTFFGDVKRPSASLMFVPIRTRGRVIGFLTIQSYTAKAYDHDDLKLLQVLGDHCGGALERSRAEQKLAQGERIQRQIINLVPHFIFAKTRDGRYIFANEALAKAYHTTVEAIVGRRDADFIRNPVELARIEQEDAAVIDRGEPLASEAEFTDPEGTVRHLQTTKIRFFPSDDQTSAVLGISIDMTERRRLDGQIQQAQKLESMSVLAGGIAHDFNNLLTGVLGNAELALTEVDPETSAAEHVRRIEVAARRASELTRQMLAYAGKGRIVVQPINLSQIVREMTGLLNTVISNRAELLLELDNAIPFTSADATQIRQVVMNVITNASDAMDGREGEIHLRTGVRSCDRAYLSTSLLGPELPEGDYVFVEVEDNGCGMDPDTQSRMFDPFFTRKPTGLVGGRGLGLAAVLGIVRNHRGAIKVISAPGAGTVFTFLLPTCESPDAAPASSEAVHVRLSVNNTGTILVVDDEDIVRTVARGALERVGFTAILARDGQEGVELFEEHQSAIRAVLLDLRMPRMDGHAAFAAMRKINPSIPIILMSGFSEQEVTPLFLGDRPQGFFEKPFSPMELLGKVQEVLAKAKRAAETGRRS